MCTNHLYIHTGREVERQNIHIRAYTYIPVYSRLCTYVWSAGNRNTNLGIDVTNGKGSHTYAHKTNVFLKISVRLFSKFFVSWIRKIWERRRNLPLFLAPARDRDATCAVVRKRALSQETSGTQTPICTCLSPARGNGVIPKTKSCSRTHVHKANVFLQRSMQLLQISLQIGFAR